MARVMRYKNRWGTSTASGGIDQQRADLFFVDLAPPTGISTGSGGGSGGVQAWQDHITFAVQNFPFPARDREMIGIKYLQQTNFVIGGDVPTGSVDISVRYAFSQETAVLLEKWHWLISNPHTGGVALTSAVKTNGVFYWLVPDIERQVASLNTADQGSVAGESQVMRVGGTYTLEGCLLKALKPSDADMTSGTGLVTLQFTLQCDRYYPDKPSDLKIAPQGLLQEITSRRTL